MTRPDTTKLLQVTTFRNLWIGDMAARLGYQVAQFMLPLLAVTILQASASQVGLVSAMLTMPVIVLSLVAGAVADRVSSRALLVFCGATRAAGFGLLGVAYAMSALDLWALVALAALVGSATVFHDIGFQATVPRVVTVEQLTASNGLLQANLSVTQMAGPALAGFLVQSAGVPLAVTITAVLFLAAAVSFWGVATHDSGPAETSQKVRLVDGLRFAVRSRPIRDLCVQSGLFNFHEQAFLTTFLIYGIREAGMSGGQTGIVIGLGSVGALVGSLVTGHQSRRMHAGRSILVALLAAAVALLVPSLVSVPVPSAAMVAFIAGFFLNGVALSVYNVFVVSLRQAIPPHRYLGAVTASYRLVSFGPMPVGALLGGVLAGAIGAGATLIVVTASMAVCSLYIFPSPVRRFRTVLEARPDQDDLSGRKAAP